MSGKRKIPEDHEWHGNRVSVVFSMVNGRIRVNWFPAQRKLRKFEERGYRSVRDKFLSEVWKLSHHVDTGLMHDRFSEEFPLFERK